MGKEFMPLFLDFNETTQDLSDEQCGRLIRALVDYANGIEPVIDGSEIIAFRFLKASIDRNEKLSAVRAAAGAKGGKQTQANASKNKQTEASETKAEQNAINKNKNTNTNTDTNNKRFVPPSLEEVTAYCRERGNKVNPQTFIDFYSSKGWKVGNQPMKDWKACVRTWEQRDRKSVTVLPAQDYHQRDYSGAQEDAFERMIRLHADQFGEVSGI